MYGPRGRITSFFRALNRAGRTPVGLYGAARAGQYIGGAARAAYSGARRRVAPTRVLPAYVKSPRRAFTGFPNSGPLVTGAGGVSAHTFAVNQSPSKQVSALERVGVPNFYTNQATTEIVATAGNQKAGVVQYGSTTDLVTLGGQNSNTAAGPNRYVLETMQSETVMTNQSTAPMDVEIWDITLKRDLPFTVNAQWKVAGIVTATQILGDPVAYWDAGICAGQGISNLASTSTEFVGTSPYDSQWFKDMFTVVKKTNVVLNQGASHRLMSMQKVHQLVDQAKWSTGVSYGTLGTPLVGLPGLTTYSLIRIKGMPCTIAPEIGSGVTLSAARLAVVQTKRYKYSWVQDSTSTCLYGEVLQSPASGNGIINIGSGAAEEQTFAPGA